VGVKANMAKLSNLGAILKTVQAPWIVAGDWNCTPQQLAKTGWLELVDGEVVTAYNTDYTCTLGVGRMIDFVVVSHRARHLLPANSIKADFGAVEVQARRILGWLFH